MHPPGVALCFPVSLSPAFGLLQSSYYEFFLKAICSVRNVLACGYPPISSYLGYMEKLVLELEGGDWKVLEQKIETVPRTGRAVQDNRSHIILGCAMSPGECDKRFKGKAQQHGLRPSLQTGDSTGGLHWLVR